MEVATYTNNTERLILVTGSGKGIGAATAAALAAVDGVRVIEVSRSFERAAVGERSNERVERLELDLLAHDAVGRIVEHVRGRRLHGLVHNAGLLHRAEMGRHERADLERLFATNVFLPLELSQALRDQLAGDPPGHIVHIGSMGGYQDSVKFPGLVGYSSSKAALACMAQCLAEDFKDAGISSNCLAIGSVDTAMLRAVFPGYSAGTSAASMGAYVADFVLHGHKLFNGKVLPVATTTP